MFYEAVYKPENTNGLSDKAKMFVGQKIAVQDGGQKQSSSGKLQVVYISTPHIGIIPNSDLENITSIPYAKWIALSEENCKKL